MASNNSEKNLQLQKLPTLPLDVAKSLRYRDLKLAVEVKKTCVSLTSTNSCIDVRSHCSKIKSNELTFI
jgi:hypothetical protein